MQSLIDKYLSEKETLLVVLLLATLVRGLVGLSPYSGEKTPPHFGDFECHRFWMETTHHFPPRLWYVDGPHMNSSYWPMDYPPLSAYSHWAMSQVIAKIEPNATVLGQSYGHESMLYRAFMRNVLIILELVIMVPAVMKLLVLLYPKQSTTTRRLYLLAYLMMPALIYVDHGHFQPNSPMHGFVLWAVYFALTSRLSLAVVFMVLAVNFKQMALYFALPFAVYALSILWKQAQAKGKGNRIKQLGYLTLRIVLLVVVLILTFAVVWWPWVSESLNGDPKHGVASVVARVFPVRRGLFEDKVASFWCVVNNFVKVHKVLT